MEILCSQCGGTRLTLTQSPQYAELICEECGKRHPLTKNAIRLVERATKDREALVKKLTETINDFFGCDAMYYDVDSYALAQHLVSHGVRL